jgi:hypothetical protein
VAKGSPARGGDDDDDGEGADGEHEVDVSKLKLPDVKLTDEKVASMEEDEDVLYKQCVVCQCCRCFNAPTFAAIPSRLLSSCGVLLPAVVAIAAVRDCTALLTASGSSAARVTSSC